MDLCINDNVTQHPSVTVFLSIPLMAFCKLYNRQQMVIKFRNDNPC
jgi:hypothetical protein